MANNHFIIIMDQRYSAGSQKSGFESRLLPVSGFFLSCSFLWALGERDFLPLAGYPRRSLNLLRISPTLLSYLSPCLIPAGFLTITIYSRLGLGLPSLRMVPYYIIQLLQLRGNVRLLSFTSCNFLPRAVPSPGCLSFPSPATNSVRDTLVELSTMPLRVCIRLVRVGLPPPFSLNHSFRYFSSGRERGRSSDTQRVRGEFIGIATGLRHLLLDCSKSTTVPHHSYGLAATIRGQGAWSDRPEKHDDINSNINSGNGTAVCLVLKLCQKIRLYGKL